MSFANFFTGSSDGRREEGAQFLPKNKAEGFGGGGKHERVNGECREGRGEEADIVI